MKDRLQAILAILASLRKQPADVITPQPWPLKTKVEAAMRDQPLRSQMESAIAMHPMRLNSPQLGSGWRCPCGAESAHYATHMADCVMDALRRRIVPMLNEYEKARKIDAHGGEADNCGNMAGDKLHATLRKWMRND